MSIVVNTNIGSLNAQRSLAASFEGARHRDGSLSSGKKINGAADDAAGFAIAERMTAQVRGLNVATKNANDGLAMLATIENATNDVTDMLQRVRMSWLFGRQMTRIPLRTENICKRKSTLF